MAESVQRQLLNHVKTVCPDMPYDLAETISDLATHILNETRDLTLRIAKTAPEPELTASLALQLLKIWIEQELSEKLKQLESAAR